MMADVTAKTADALLTAMDAEEPFRLLRTLPGRLQELSVADRQRTDSEARLVGEVALIQSQNRDSIRSATSEIQGWKKQIKSLSDAHVQCFQREADILQDSLEKLRDSHRSKALPRRHRVKGVSVKDIDKELSKLQDSSARIQEIARYVRDTAQRLARDEISLNVLAEQIFDEVGLTLGDPGAGVRPGSYQAADSDGPNPEEVERPLNTLIKEMEKRCEEVETRIALNNETIDKQTEEIEQLRRILSDSWGSPDSVGEANDGLAGRHGGELVSLMFATTASVAVALLIAFSVIL